MRAVEAPAPPEARTAAARAWSLPGRTTRAFVDLDALTANVAYVRRLLGPTTALMAVVKADGYGHGAVMVALTAVEAGADHLGVATIGEGVALRRAGLTVPILVLGSSLGCDLDAAVRHRLALAVAGLDELAEVEAAAWRVGAREPVAVHLKVDTGMRRYGAEPRDAVGIARAVASRRRLALAGVFTHFADADGGDATFTRAQGQCFDAVLGRLGEEGLRPPLAHAANSAAALGADRARHAYDLVRLGIAMYGLSPWADRGLPEPMRPVLELRTRVVRVFDLAPGDTVGYGRTFRAAGSGRAALLPIGYADGLRRTLSNRGWVGLGGDRAAILGRVSMDQTVVGVPSGRAVRVGDEAVLLAGRGEDGPTAAEVAALTETIAYEVVCGLAPRVPRYYLRGDRVVAVADGDGLRGVPETGGG
jgi:alanine racemase